MTSYLSSELNSTEETLHLLHNDANATDFSLEELREQAKLLELSVEELIGQVDDAKNANIQGELWLRVDRNVNVKC